MTLAAVYLKTADRGAVIESLRVLVGDRDETWHAPPVDEDQQGQIERDAAAWIRERLAQDRRTKDALGLLIVDGAGSLFAWADVPEGVEAAHVADSIRRAGAPLDEDAAVEGEPVSTLAAAPDIELPEGLTLEPLADPMERDEGVHRVALAAVPDLATRLLLDQLDELGVSTQRVMSVWQAATLAWNRPPGRTEHTSEAVVDASSADRTTAAVVVDPDSGRLLWSWMRNERCIASGACRLAKDGSAPEWALNRLCVEWLGWSSQLGVHPAHVLFVQPPAAMPTPPAAVLARHWPQATVDALDMDDPLAATIARAADRFDASPATATDQLASLSSRPGRLQRSSRRWISLAMIAAALGLSLSAWRLHESSTETASVASDTRSSWRGRVEAIDPVALEPGVLDPLLYLEDELAARQREVAPVARRRPVLNELESVSLVIGYDGVQLESIKFNQLAAVLSIKVESTQEYEDVAAALSAIDGSEISNWEITPRTVGDEIRVTFRGIWDRIGPQDPQP